MALLLIVFVGVANVVDFPPKNLQKTRIVEEDVINCLKRLLDY